MLAGHIVVATCILGSFLIGFVVADRSRRMECRSPFEVAWSMAAELVCLVVGSLIVPWESWFPWHL